MDDVRPLDGMCLHAGVLGSGLTLDAQNCDKKSSERAMAQGAALSMAFVPSSSSIAPAAEATNRANAHRPKKRVDRRRRRRRRRLWAGPGASRLVITYTFSVGHSRLTSDYTFSGD